MIRVQVRNFQSIAQSSVDIDGLTVITGPNNSGKTALMRAVRGVFTNAKGTSFVRYGADNCEVCVEFADGNTVTWEKGKTANRYTVNGKMLDKVGAGVPDEVEALGIVPITAGNATVWPQIAPQFTGQVFLLDQSGSVVAEALADVERVGKLSRALKACDGDKRQAQSELKVRRADAKTLVAEMATFDGMDDAVAGIANIERDGLALHADQARIKELQGLAERLDEHRDQVAKLAGIESISVPSADETLTASQTGSRLSDLTTIRTRLSAAKTARAKYDGADTLACPTAADAQAVMDTKQKLADLTALQAKRNAAKATHAKLADFVAPDLDAGKTERTIKALEVIKNLKAQRDAHRKDQDDLRGTLQNTQAEVSAVQALINEMLAQLPACPTCGNAHKDCK